MQKCWSNVCKLFHYLSKGVPIQQIKRVIVQARAGLGLHEISYSNAEYMVEWASVGAKIKFTTLGVQI